MRFQNIHISRKIKLKERYLHFFLFKNKQGKIPIRKRTASDIWKHLYEFPMIETSQEHHFIKTDIQLIQQLGLSIQSDFKLTNLGQKGTN